MKHRKRIIVIIIFIIILIVMVPLIRKKILFYQVRDRFLATIYDVKRNGNFYAVFHYKMQESNQITTSDGLTEVYAKDGENMIIRYFENEDGTNSKTIFFMKDGYEYSILEKSDGNVSGVYRPIQWFNKINTENVIGNLLLNVFQDGEVKKIEEGEYKGKECYILTVKYDTAIEDTIYIDQETYLPYKIISVDSETGFYEENEWITLELNTVKELPEYDLEMIKENAVPALEQENSQE